MSKALAAKILPLLPIFGQDKHGMTARELAHQLAPVSTTQINRVLTFMSRHCKQFPVCCDQEDEACAPEWWTFAARDQKKKAEAVFVPDMNQLRLVSIKPVEKKFLALFDASNLESVLAKCDSSSLFVSRPEVSVVVWADKGYSGLGSEDKPFRTKTRNIRFSQTESDHKQAADVRICDEVLDFMSKCSSSSSQQAVILIVSKDKIFVPYKELAQEKGHLLTIECRFEKVQSWFASAK